MFPDLSLEFLMGRALDNAMLNVGMKDIARGGLSPKVKISYHGSLLTAL
jgi:glucan phosphorylase